MCVEQRFGDIPKIYAVNSFLGLCKCFVCDNDHWKTYFTYQKGCG